MLIDFVPCIFLPTTDGRITAVWILFALLDWRTEEKEKKKPRQYPCHCSNQWHLLLSCKWLTSSAVVLPQVCHPAENKLFEQWILFTSDSFKWNISLWVTSPSLLYCEQRDTPAEDIVQENYVSYITVRKKQNRFH